jgi:hypothetical protein
MIFLEWRAVKSAILFRESADGHLVCRRLSMDKFYYPQSLPVRENREGFFNLLILRNISAIPHQVAIGK